MENTYTIVNADQPDVIAALDHYENALNAYRANNWVDTDGQYHDSYLARSNAIAVHEIRYRIAARNRRMLTEYCANGDRVTIDRYLIYRVGEYYWVAARLSDGTSARFFNWTSLTLRMPAPKYFAEIMAEVDRIGKPAPVLRAVDA